MNSDLAQHIEQTFVMDTHEHMKKEDQWTNGPSDVLADLFTSYAQNDLKSAGASTDAAKQSMASDDPDIERRWMNIEPARSAMQFTGYGEAVRIIAQDIYEMDRITPETLRSAQPKLDELRQPGGRLHLLRDRAKLDHIQTDDICWPCLPDDSGPNFFLYDLSWATFCEGNVQPDELARETDITVKNLSTLQQGMESLFENYGSIAIAVKSQHAYHRTLRWTDRSNADADRALQAILTHPDNVDESTRRCLGDWCWARGVELAIQHNLPFKIHTGYYAGNGNMIADRVPSGHLCPLLAKYPDARFVLMHTAYPYSDEIIALTKHFPNTWSDLCWAWAINPYATVEFVRRFLHAAPVNKLFVFGGDTGRPTSAYAYSVQMRRYLLRALQAEVDDGYMSESQAIEVVTRFMRTNQMDCFDLDGTRAAIAQTSQPVTV